MCRENQYQTGFVVRCGRCGWLDELLDLCPLAVGFAVGCASIGAFPSILGVAGAAFLPKESLAGFIYLQWFIVGLRVSRLFAFAIFAVCGICTTFAGGSGII